MAKRYIQERAFRCADGHVSMRYNLPGSQFTCRCDGFDPAHGAIFGRCGLTARAEGLVPDVVLGREIRDGVYPAPAAGATSAR